MATIFILLNLLNSYIKRLLSGGFNIAATRNSPMKNHVALKRSVGHYWAYNKVVILLENFLIWFE